MRSGMRKRRWHQQDKKTCVFESDCDEDETFQICGFAPRRRIEVQLQPLLELNKKKIGPVRLFCFSKKKKHPLLGSVSDVPAVQPQLYVAALRRELRRLVVHRGASFTAHGTWKTSPFALWEACLPLEVAANTPRPRL